MALFAFDYNLLAYLNSFDDLSKDRCLSYTNKYHKPYKSLTLNQNEDSVFKFITIENKPSYAHNDDLGQYFLDCK